MQFPWRDFAWFTLLIGLAIGLAVEHQRVRRFAALSDKIALYEQKVFALAKEICEPSGGQFRIDEENEIILLPTAINGHFVNETVYVPAPAWSRREIDKSWLTGMEDLDRALSLVLPSLLLAVVLQLRVRKTTPAGDTIVTNVISRHSHPILEPIGILVFAALSIAGFCGARPFTATIFLGAAVGLLCRSITISRKSPPEGSQQARENSSEGTVDIASWKAALRFPLRDFLWLTILIGLSAAIVVEHKRARELSVLRDRVKWWSRAADGIQSAHGRLVKSSPARVP